MTRGVVNPDSPDWDRWKLDNPGQVPPVLNGAPAVFPLGGEAVVLTRLWQNYLVAINPGMVKTYVGRLLGNTRAFCNGTGFPGRANWIDMADIFLEYPRFDKVRTCARSTFKGAIDGAYLVPEMLDGTTDPPDPAIINPKLTPWLFFAASNLKRSGTLFPFDNGSTYSWTPDPLKMFSYLPHVRGKTVIRIPLNHVVKTDRVESPYLTY